MTDNKNIVEIVDEKIREIRTKSLDISFNEILDMYENKELIIDPDYQRLFRWDDERQSQFIESIILEMPLPPVFFMENQDGTLELIDGLQRISTYLKFRGELKDPDTNQAFPQTILKGCDILEELNGKSYDDLNVSIRLKLKRNFIRAEVLQKQTQNEMRYHLFKRLNTGGIDLEPQEIRNCTVRILDDKFINFIKKLANNNQDFTNCTQSISPDDKKKMLHEECVLRFFALKNDFSNYKDKMDKFLDDYLETITRDNEEKLFNLSNEKVVFDKTFTILNKILGEEIFKNKNVNRFSTYQFEAFSLGILDYIDKINLDDQNQLELIQNAFLDLKNNPIFKDVVSGSFLFKKQPIIKRIDLVKGELSKLLD